MNIRQPSNPALAPEIAPRKWTAEIADSSLSYDLEIKAPLYATFGVREYWVIDARTLKTTVHRQPRAGAYTDCQVVEGSGRLVPLLAPTLAITLGSLDLG